MPRNPVPLPTSTERLQHLADLTSSIRSTAADLDDSATSALFSAFPTVRNQATRRFAANLVRIRLAMADVERVLLSRNGEDQP